MAYNVLEYGALGDGVTDDAAAIQKAIDLCAANGGGRVVLPGGHMYLSGAVELKSHVEFYLEQGAVLKASPDISAYFLPNGNGYAPVSAVSGEKAVPIPVTAKPSFAFIHAKDAEAFSITGQGTIDGNVHAFVERVSKYYCNGTFYPRPTMIYVENCRHISFCNVTLQNAPFWTLHPAGCDDVLIEGIRILNPLDCTNSDGIDPDHSSNVRIIGCTVQCADDCICLKTTAGNREYGPTRNVLISGCTLTSTSAAVKIGTEGVGDFENIVVDNCIITGSNRGLSIQIRDGGNVRNVSFSNIVIETRRFAECWWGCAEPIVLTTHGRTDETASGHIENVRFFNISCRGENGIFVAGTEDNHIQDVVFERVWVTLLASSKWPKGRYDLRPGSECYGLVYRKTPAALLQWADDVSFRDCRFGFEGMEREAFAEGLKTENCTQVTLDHVKAESASEAFEAIVIG
ncbi:MAG: glycoside hydrolase family 28 protein [Clostridia bacterium]|nr:glycoside hydrolase family 28 protein [Clostridia bacterium]